MATDHPAGRPATNNGRHVLLLALGGSVPTDGRSWATARELAKADYVVSVICPKKTADEPADEWRNGVRVFRFTPSSSGSRAMQAFFGQATALIWGFLLSLRVFFTMGVQAIHVVTPPAGGTLIAGFFAVFFTKQLVLEPRILSGSAVPGPFERLVRRTASLLVAGDGVIAAALRNQGVAEEKLCVIRPAPDAAQVKPVAPQASLRHGARYLVVSRASLQRAEELRHLLEAARILSQERQRKDVRFVIVGAGPGLDKARKLASLQGVADIVSFPGALENEARRQLFCTSDICVSAVESGEPEAVGITENVLEYMALGRPVVQFDTPQGRDAAVDASLYAPSGNPQDLADKMLSLLEDAAQRRDLADKARSLAAREGSWQNEAPKLLAAYDRIFTVLEKPRT